MNVRAKLLRLLRVDREPRPPEGDRDIRIFRAARNYFWYRASRLFVKNTFALLGLSVALGMSNVLATVISSIVGLGDVTLPHRTILLGLVSIKVAAIAFFALHAIGSLILLRLDFEQRWYIVTDRSLRIREGLVRLREQTVTFANVQQVTIRQGPLQRLLRIADLHVRTAGGKGEEVMKDSKRSNPHVAIFRGIAHAELVRDAIRERLARHRDAGLGDPDDESVPELLSASTELAREARLLRTAITRGE